MVAKFANWLVTLENKNKPTTYSGTLCKDIYKVYPRVGPAAKLVGKKYRFSTRI